MVVVVVVVVVCVCGGGYEKENPGLYFAENIPDHVKWYMWFVKNIE